MTLPGSLGRTPQRRRIGTGMPGATQGLSAVGAGPARPLATVGSLTRGIAPAPPGRLIPGAPGQPSSLVLAPGAQIIPGAEGQPASLVPPGAGGSPISAGSPAAGAELYRPPRPISLYQPDASGSPAGAGDTFGPGRDLRFTSIVPTASPETARLQQQLSGAVGNLLGPRAGIAPTDSSRLAELRGLTTGAARTVASAPDRLALVNQALADYDLENQPRLAAAYRAVGQRSAALGRGGSAMTDQDIGDVATNYERNRLLARNALVRDAVGATLADRLSQLGALGGLEAQTQGLEAATRGELRGERDFATGLDLQRVGTLSGLYGQQADLDRVGREERRGERDYQYGVAEDARRAGIEQRLLEEQLYGADFNRNLALAGMGDPGALAGYLSGAGATAANAAGNYYGMAGNLFGNWLSRRNNPAAGR